MTTQANHLSFKNSKIRFLALTLIFLLVLGITGCDRKDTLTLSGTVESTQIEVNSEVSGKVLKMDKDEGAAVKKGDVIATLDASFQELAVKQQEALLNLKTARLDEIKSLPKIPDLQLKQAEADLEQSKFALDQAKLILSKYQIKSPVDGTLIMKNVNMGDLVGTGTSVGTVTDLNDLSVKFYIPQKHLKLVSLNQELYLTTSALPDKTIKGKITYIASKEEFTPKNTETEEAKENTVYKLKVKILDHLEDLKPGMTVSSDIPMGGE
ncbi:MAG: efflux RND transporter periplasmic adaptor subunit [Clostridia bacterium]|nr:efflux RND transporter periplasmic adaptor subunit [Clostridia bacterium]